MVREDRINDFLNGRLFLLLVSVAYIIASLTEAASGRLPAPRVGNGMFFTMTGTLIENRLSSAIVNILCTLGTAALLLVFNHLYNFVRSFTFVFASMFVFMQMVNPFIGVQFNAGSALCLVLMGCVFVLFGSYQQKATSQRNIFLVFSVLSFCCSLQYVFLFLIPVFFIGFIQMRSMNFRGFLAFLIGLVTPYWIMIGLGIVDFNNFKLPQMSNISDILESQQTWLLVGTTAFTAVLGIVLFIINMFSIFNYRLQIRVYNGFFILLTAMTILIMVADYKNFPIYLPILNLCVAIQIAHTFTISNHLRRYLFVVVLLVAGIASFVAQSFAL